MKITNIYAIVGLDGWIDGSKYRSVAISNLFMMRLFSNSI